MKLSYRLLFPFLLFSCSLFTEDGWSQQGRDTLNLDNINIARHNKFLNNIFQDAINSMKRNPNDTIDQNAVLIAKSEKIYSSYEGRIVRKIIIQNFGFERTFSDTANRINYVGTRILNALHTDTREWVIRNHIFINENAPLNAFELADNERYLRTLEFIQDARIFPIRVPGSADSVDIMVITKDLFSIAAVLDVSGLSGVKLRVAEANLLGMGQKIQVTGLWEQNRHPFVGYEALYSKNNIGGTFVNGTIAYTKINTGRSDGHEEEDAFYVRLERPLVSPFSHVAGGIEVSSNVSDNVYQKPDSFFYHYRYNVYDVWAGYNLGTKKFKESKNYTNNRNRTFVSLRYMQTVFNNVPIQIGDYFDPVYNNKQAVLGQISFFRQDFYKLNYIYGFGTTEDIPTGYNVSLTSGWYRQRDLERPYGGLQAEQYYVTPDGGFLQSAFRMGGFYHNGTIEDASALARISYFTPLYLYRQSKIRERIIISYTQLNKRIIYEPLKLNNPFGLHEFSNDSIVGDKRISMYSETILYTPYKMFGFRFAPFVYGEFSLMTPERAALKKADIYTGIGGGVRTRNENLVFGTIELKCMYFPRPVAHVSQIRVTLSSDIRFRYRTTLIKAPDIVQLNRDDI